MASPFAKAFVKLRRQAGFETAYQFFHNNGGRRSFGCSFQNYLRIEHGSHLPLPSRLPGLCRLLQLPLRGSDLRGLVRAYLETWTGSEDTAHWLVAPFAKAEEPEAPLAPAAQALRRLVRERSRPLGLEHYKSVMSSAGAYWSFRVLTNSREGHTPEGIARIVGLEAGAVRKGLQVLLGTGIARRRPDGRYASPYAGQVLVFPDPLLFPTRLKKAAARYTAAMLRRKGAVVDVRHCGVRADGRAILGFIPHLREAVRGVNAYAVQDKTDRSAFFLVEAKVLKLFDF